MLLIRIKTNKQNGTKIYKSSLCHTYVQCKVVYFTKINPHKNIKQLQNFGKKRKGQQNNPTQAMKKLWLQRKLRKLGFTRNGCWSAICTAVTVIEKGLLKHWVRTFLKCWSLTFHSKAITYTSTNTRHMPTHKDAWIYACIYTPSIQVYFIQFAHLIPILFLALLPLLLLHLNNVPEFQYSMCMTSSMDLN